MGKNNRQKTYIQSSEKFYCYITRGEFENHVNTKVENDIVLEHPDTFANLILNTPNESNSRKLKFSDFNINDSNTDSFLKTLFNSLKIPKPIMFNTYFKGIKSKTNVADEALTLLKSQKPGLINYCGNSGIKNKLYIHLRNAFAHGNISYVKGQIVFYSFSQSKAKIQSETDKLVFYLCLKEERLLKQFIYVLNSFKLRT